MKKIKLFSELFTSKFFEITFVFFEQTQSIKIWSDQVITFYFQIICAIFTLLNPGRKII